MCKVLMIAGIKKEHQEKVAQILEIGSRILSKTEEDGVGYAAITNEGKIYGEKWLNKEDAFKLHEQPKPDFADIYMESLLDESAEYEDKKVNTGIVYGRFGQMTKSNIENTVAVMLHTRKKTTGDKSIENTHPFFLAETKDNPDTALIHNGSIYNHAQLTKTMSSCDSETLLHEYLKNSMSYNPWGIHELAQTVRGEYTVGVLSSSYENNEVVPSLDIFKSNKDLYAAYCPEIETTLFTTWKWNLEEIAKEAGVTLKNVAKIKDGFFIRINAITGIRTEDLISFKLSDKFMYNPEDYNRNNHHGPNTRSEANIRTVTKVEDDIEDTIDSIKTKFEMNHSELFMHKYHQPSGLNAKEQAFLDSLTEKEGVNFRALRLVQDALGIKLSS